MHTGEAVGRTEVEQSVLLARSAGKLRVRKDSQSVIREGFTEGVTFDLGFGDNGKRLIMRARRGGLSRRRGKRRRWVLERETLGVSSKSCDGTE